MSLELNGKSVLFIGPETFNYEKEIVAELKQLGAQVVYRSDKPGKAFLLKVLLRLFPRALWQYSDHIFSRWLAENGPIHCDVVFIIKGEGLSPSFIRLLKDRYKKAAFVYYLWDSVRNVRGAELKFASFDHLFSFDPEDCRKYKGFRYRPLFFLERYRATQSSAGQACFFIGTLNGDRPAVVSRLIPALSNKTSFDYWLFVRSGFELFLRRIFDSSLKKIDPSRLLRVPMSSNVIRQHFQSSAAIVDIEHPNQRGLTMRTFEVLASGKKLLTTNKNISSHDFYHPSRIGVIDRNKPQLDKDFLEMPAAAMPAWFYTKYSIRGWLLEILECVAAVNSVPENEAPL
jgi:hypothetical protein